MANFINRRRMLAAAAGLPCAASWRASAAAAGKAIPVDEFFRTPLLSGLKLSPNGRHVAGIRGNPKGIENATVHDIATGKTLILTNFSDSSVARLDWIDSERLMLSLVDRTRGSGEQMSGGLQVIDRDGSNYKPLVERSLLSGATKLLPFGSSFAGWVTSESGARTQDILAISPTMTARGRFDSNLYRVNTTNGRFSLLTSGGPKDVVDWVVDRSAVPRVAVSSLEGRTTVHFRDSAAAPWRTIFSFDPEEGDKAVTPLAFDAAGRLYVAAAAGKDENAIYRYDAAQGRLDPEPLVAVKGFDINGGLRFSADGSTLLGVRLEADRPMTVWFDEARIKLQAAIDKAWPDSVNELQFATGGNGPVLIHSWSDRDPGRYFLYDPDKKRMEELGKERPWVAVDAMRPTRFFRFNAADGLSIPGQLTLPDGAGPHPLVVLHYGGPWVRPIHWHWDPVVQFLASRGYAVYMPAPRASTGFGFKLFRAGWKQWGLGMQDDVTAGVEHLVGQGVVDRSRVAILGASYGGYLAMMALVKEPKLFRCAVNWVGVTDPSFMFSVTWTDFNRLDSGRFTLPLLIGDPDKDKDQFRRTSPVERAAEITRPVLMAYGGMDQRVPIVNGERMRSALRANGRDPAWLVYPEEGHGWLKEENNVDFWGRVEKFLAQHMGATG